VSQKVLQKLACPGPSPGQAFATGLFAVSRRQLALMTLGATLIVAQLAALATVLQARVDRGPAPVLAMKQLIADNRCLEYRLTPARQPCKPDSSPADARAGRTRVAAIRKPVVPGPGLLN
jgi:hypothetical protein